MHILKDGLQIVLLESFRVLISENRRQREIDENICFISRFPLEID